MEPSKRDWKLFRDKISTWQENYMEKQIKQDKKKPGVMLDLRKQEMVFYIVRLINDKAITMDDLEEFSDELRDYVKYLQEK